MNSIAILVALLLFTVMFMVIIFIQIITSTINEAKENNIVKKEYPDYETDNYASFE